MDKPSREFTPQACVQQETAVHLRLDREEPAVGAADCGPYTTCIAPSKAIAARDGKVDAGLMIRPPASGRIMVCASKMTCAPGNEGVLLLGDIVPVPQFGQLRFLPFKNGPFESNQLTLALAADGSIQKFEYQGKAAAAVRAMAATSDMAGQYRSFADERRDEAKQAVKDERETIAAIRADELLQAQQQLALLDARKAVLARQLAAPTSAERNQSLIAQREDLLEQEALDKARRAAAIAAAALAAPLPQ